MPTSSTSKSLAAALLALACVAPAGAAIFGDDEARRAIIDLRARMEQQNAESQRRLAELAARLDRLETASGASSRGALETGAQMEQMRQEIARLRGALEQQANELATTQSRLKDQYAEVDGRLKRFEPVQATVDGRAVVVDQTEKRQYEQALERFRAGDFRVAATGFERLLATAPQSPYAAGSRFWLGSALFGLKDWKGAVAAHQALLAQAPDHPRAPDAMLAIASAQLEQGDKRAARATLQGVLDRHGNTPAAEAARERLAAIK